MKRIVVLISGNGSNLQALIDSSAAGLLDAEIVAVISNKPDAYGLTRAERAGIATDVLSLKDVLANGGNRVAFDVELAALVASYEPDLVVLAGWMLVVGEAFLTRFPEQVINLHPALPGTFAGTHAIERAHTAFERGEIEKTGVMVHYVIPEVDAGPVITQETVPIHPGESVDELEGRIHNVEHRLIVAATNTALEA